MPASITLSGLSYSTPDGRLLFDNLNIAFGAERTGLVGRDALVQLEARPVEPLQRRRRLPPLCLAVLAGVIWLLPKTRVPSAARLELDPVGLGLFAVVVVTLMWPFLFTTGSPDDDPRRWWTLALFAVFGVLPTVPTLIGSAMIAACGVYSAHRERRRVAEEQPERPARQSAPEKESHQDAEHDRNTQCRRPGQHTEHSLRTPHVSAHALLHHRRSPRLIAKDTRKSATPQANSDAYARL